MFFLLGSKYICICGHFTIYNLIFINLNPFLLDYSTQSPVKNLSLFFISADWKGFLVMTHDQLEKPFQSGEINKLVMRHDELENVNHGVLGALVEDIRTQLFSIGRAFKFYL